MALTPKSCRFAPSLLSHARTIHSSPVAYMRRVKLDPETIPVRLDRDGIGMDHNEATSASHLALRQQRQLLYYMRLIEHEMPQLVGMSRICMTYVLRATR